MKTGLSNAASSIDLSSKYRMALKKVDARKVLEKYNARNIIVNGDELIHSCIIDKVKPHHSNGDENPSASLNINKKLYSCYSYGGGDLLWLIQEMESCSRESAIQIVLGFVDTRFGEDGEDLVRIVAEYFHSEDREDPIPSYSSIILRPWRKIHPYMTDERELNRETLKRYSVGYDMEQDKIVIPHFWEGKLVGWQKRRLATTPPEPGNPKYKSSPSFPKHRTLFNYDTIVERGVEDIVLVESPMSVLKAESLYDSGSEFLNNVVATFGSKTTLEQLDLLKNFRTVTIYFDADPAGYLGACKVYDGIKDFVRVFMVWPKKGIDMADQDAEELEWILSTRKLGAITVGKMRKAWEDGKEEERKRRDSEAYQA